MARAVLSSACSHGITAQVERSGTRNMSDSAMRAKPSIEEPSNHLPLRQASSNWWMGIATDLTMPMRSVNCKLTKRIFSLTAFAITLSTSAWELPADLGVHIRSGRVLTAAWPFERAFSVSDIISILRALGHIHNKHRISTGHQIG